MTPAAIFSIVKDIVILIVVGIAVYMVLSYGKDIVKVDDMQAVQKQLAANAQTEVNWQKEQTDANTRRDAAIAQVAATIGEQRAPVFVRSGPANTCPVSGAPPKASGATAASGTTDTGSGVDIRTQINAFELHYETALADCRAALDKWPQ